MKVRVVRLRQQGVPDERTQVNHDLGVVGELFVEEHVDESCGRALRVARPASERPLDQSLLPMLADVQLLWYGNQGFVLARVERIGDTNYGQSWWCRLP